MKGVECCSGRGEGMTIVCEIVILRIAIAGPVPLWLWQTHVDVKSPGGNKGQLLARLALRIASAGPVPARTVVFVCQG